jgi:hypothetical protein
VWYGARSLAVYAAALLRKNINFAALFFCRYTPHGKLCATSLFILGPFFVSGDKTAEQFFTCSALQSHPPGGKHAFYFSVSERPLPFWISNFQNIRLLVF